MLLRNVGFINLCFRRVAWVGWKFLNCWRLNKVTLSLDPAITQQRFDGPLQVPRLRLSNFSGPYEVIMTLVDEQQRAHPHQLVGPGCRDGVCVVRGGARDAVMHFWNDGRLKLISQDRRRKGAQISNEELRSTEREVTRVLVQKMWQTLKGYFTSTTVDFKGLKIEPTLAINVRQALDRRKNVSSKILTIDGQRLNHKPVIAELRRGWLGGVQPGDPFHLGFSHRTGRLDLACVRLSFTVILDSTTYLRVPHSLPGDKLAKDLAPVTSQAIHDTTPRVLAMSHTRAAVDERKKVLVKVNMEEVDVEFFDRDSSWSVVVTVDEESPETDASTREVEVEVPVMSQAIAEEYRVGVRLVPRGGEAPGPAVPFTYMPSLVKEEVREETSKDWLAMAAEKEATKKEDYVILFEREAEKIPDKPSVLRPVKEKEAPEQAPAKCNDDHKRAKARDWSKMFDR